MAQRVWLRDDQMQAIDMKSRLDIFTFSMHITRQGAPAVDAWRSAWIRTCSGTSVCLKLSWQMGY